MIYQTEHWDYLLRLARASIAHGFEHDAPLHASNRGVPAPYSARRAAYVALTVHGENRGCMGDTQPTLSLYDSVRTNAYRAAFGDERFFRPGRSVMELGSLRVFVFTDSRPASIAGLGPHDSIVVSLGGTRATLLSPYRGSRSNEDFVRMAQAKAGLSKVPTSALKIVALRTEFSRITPINEIGEFDHEWF